MSKSMVNWYGQMAARLNKSLAADGFPLVSAAEVRSFVEGRGSHCEACGRVMVRRVKLMEHSLTLDHDHATGKLRGVLCSRCNRCLGMFKDSPTALRRALCYLS